MDTIFARSSGSPPAAIAIVRLSGPHALDAGRALAGTLPEPRVAGLRALHDPRDATLLDRALVLVFPAPRTATGEDVVELHVHGGRAVVAAVEQALDACAGLRRAEPGEFTRRALANGVIDLTEAEGLGDLLAAETEDQRRTALRIAEGGLRARIEQWTTRLVTIAAQIEAQIDFSDEDDVADAAIDALASPVVEIVAEMDALLAEPPVERLRDGIHVVLAGPPNQGKSTLLNALAGREAAIVSPIAGTTRDRIEVPVVRNGIAYVLTDTAGLAEDSDDPIERIGIERTRDAVAKADILLWLGDTASQGDAIRVHARADLPERAVVPVHAVAVSVLGGTGMSDLWDRVEDRARALLPASGALVLNERHRRCVLDSRTCLARAGDARDILLLAEDLRAARAILDRITGRAGSNDVLDAIFSRFCIGK